MKFFGMRKILTVIAFTFACCVLWSEQRPNFIFILTDDQQVGLMGCDGNPIVKTPHLDQFAKDGVVFDNAHITSAICTPSRVSIFLSQFERKHGVNFNSGTAVAPEAWSQSYPVVIRENGYYTGYIGKNHSPVGEGGYASQLMERSFDYWYAGHGHLSFYPKKRHRIFSGAKSDTQIEVIQEGLNDFFSNEHQMEGALHFLDSRPKNKPFCLSLCFNLPHGSSTGTMKMLESDDDIYKTLYRDKKIPLPEHYVAKEDVKNPKLPSDLLRADERQTGYNYVDKPDTTIERLTRQMQAMTGIDRLLGNLRSKLKTLGVDKNTIIIFTSDHGLFMGEFGLGGKALCYEKTTHVPFMVYNPMLDDKLQGRELNSLVQSIDIAPTLLDYAGIDIPDSFQGKSLRPILDGQKTDIRNIVYTENLWSTQFGNPRCESVQNKEWKYIRYYKNENLRASAKIKVAKELGIPVNDMLYATHDPDIAQYRQFVEAGLNGEEPVYEELFNLKVDPDETTNLVNDGASLDILKKMRVEWAVAIKKARGKGTPKVLRYTKDSSLEKGEAVAHM